MFSLYEVLISLYTVVNSLYAVLSPCRAFFSIYVVLFSLFAVANSLYAVLFFRYLHGASLSLDLKRGPWFISLNCGVYRHFDRATYIKFRLSTISERFSRKHGSNFEFVRYSEVERVELEVVACLSGGNLASVELGAVTIGYF